MVRQSPKESATLYDIDDSPKRGLDGNFWKISINKNGVKRWVRGSSGVKRSKSNPKPSTLTTKRKRTISPERAVPPKRSTARRSKTKERVARSVSRPSKRTRSSSVEAVTKPSKSSSKGMTEDTFWSLVKKIDFLKSNSVKTEKVFAEIRKGYTDSQLRKAQGILVVKFNNLYKRFEKFWIKSLGLSDDSFSDLISSVVSMGKRAYETITERRLKQMAENMVFEEGFFNIFEDIMNWKPQTKETKRAARKGVEEFMNLFTEGMGKATKVTRKKIGPNMYTTNYYA